MPSAPGDSTRLARVLFPEQAEELDRALQRAQEQRGIAPADPVETALADAALRAREGAFGRAAFTGFGGEEAERFERAFTLARAVAARGNLTVPEPEAFWNGAEHRARLVRALIADQTLLPVAAPYGVGSTGWMALFRAAARQTGSPLSLSTPLVVAPEIVAAFESLDTPPQGAVVARAGEVMWTLRLIPAAPKPPLVGVNHATGPHPTLPEMLMLQLMRIAAAEEPVDRASFTWVDGTLGGGKFAARTLFDASDRTVRVNTREIGNQGPHLGARPPIG